MLCVGMAPTEEEVSELLSFMDCDDNGIIELPEMINHMAAQVG